MEKITVNIKGQMIELRYPYKTLKKIERETKSMFSLVKPTLENAEKLVKYGVEYFKKETGTVINDEYIENATEQLSVEFGMFDMITMLMKNYMHAVNPKMEIDEESNKELDEEGLKMVNNIVSDMFGNS